jgi:CBS domain containing-hemolysin-like protein
MKENRKWIITTFILTFALAMVFGGVSNVVIEKMNLIMAIIVLILVIALGIVFDMIGMAVATCEEAPFHAKAAKKHSGAREVIKLLKEKDKATNVCNDLIGDICGIISGSACALISVKLSAILSLDVVIVSLVLSAMVAMITVGGKAIGKGISMNNAENIMYIVGAVLHIVKPVKEKKKAKKHE